MHLNQNVNVRSSGRLNEPMFSSSTSSERCFEYYAPRSYNKLSDDIKSLNSVGSFKSLGTYIQGHLSPCIGIFLCHCFRSDSCCILTGWYSNCKQPIYVGKRGVIKSGNKLHGNTWYPPYYNLHCSNCLDLTSLVIELG